MTETRGIAVQGLTFTVDMAGPADGTPVLLLHGFPETRHMWRAPLEALGREGFRAVAPDQRGYSAGARPPATEAYATEHLVADALGLMDALGAPRFHLVGHDWGGQLAWLIAAGHADRIVTLSVFSRPHPAAFARAMAEDPAQAERSRHHRAFRRDDAVARMREAKLQPLREAILAQGVPPADAEIYLEALMQPGGIEGAMAWYRASGVAGADTPAVAAPTLYVWGDADATVGRRAAGLTADHVTGPYRLVTLEGAGHFLVDQFPHRVSELIIGHLHERRETP
ncbi:MAG TPA: alpha/beta hydrolase [Caulobacteraceae bacterium]|nr:alpha/beta hydrolase [Caulobacteraceae bacterium]